MQLPARQISTCPTCGAALEETFGGGGSCMFCLLQAGIGSEQETVHDSTPDAPKGGVRFGVYEVDLGGGHRAGAELVLEAANRDAVAGAIAADARHQKQRDAAQSVGATLWAGERSDRAGVDI